MLIRHIRPDIPANNTIYLAATIDRKESRTMTYNLYLQNIKTDTREPVTLKQAVKTMRNEYLKDEATYHLYVYHDYRILGIIQKIDYYIGIAYFSGDGALAAWLVRKIKGVKLTDDFTGRDFRCRLIK